MHPWNIWVENPIFIELGVRDADVALSLREDDYTRYLGVCDDDARVERLQNEYPSLADQLACTQRPELALNNNAEVLILRGKHTRSLWRYRAVRHCNWVVWPLALTLPSVIGLLGCLWHLLLGRFSFPRIVTFRTPAGKARRMLCTRVRLPKMERGSRHFVPHRLGLTGLFRELAEGDVRYAVLRWFERQATIEPTEEINMLVADASLADVLDILRSEPGILPCDVYSESGLADSQYRGTSYFPPNAARRILASAQLHSGLCLVPSPRDHFHGFAYHAVYHLGLQSNLPHIEMKLDRQVESEHDVADVLREMAKRLWIDVEISLEGLHAYLQKAGWGPTPEMLACLARAERSNLWLQRVADELAARHKQEILAPELTPVVRNELADVHGDTNKTSTPARRAA